MKDMSKAPNVDSKNIITLKGSVSIIKEFFHTAINSILYQRGELSVSDRYIIINILLLFRVTT